MAKKVVFSVLGVVVFLGLTGVGGYMLWKLNQPEKPVVTASLSTPTATDKTGEKSVLGVTNGDARSLQGNALNKDQTTQNEQPQTSPQNRLPTPDQFEAYEQYESKDAAAYVDIVQGTGIEAKENVKVAVVYSGWLTNGQLFDQTKKDEDGKLVPFIFTLGAREVVPGFEQAMYGMKVGGKRRLVIPSKLGYGEAGQGSIPPNSMLIFDVELVDALDMQTGL